MNRRGFLATMLAAATAPAIVRAESIMVVRRPLVIAAPVVPATLPGPFSFDGGATWDFTAAMGLFQDVAGTIPVTAIGQPVGRIRDLTGNGNDLVACSPVKPRLVRCDRTGLVGVDFDLGSPLMRVDDAIFSPAKPSPPYTAYDRAAYPPEIKPKRHS